MATFRHPLEAEIARSTLEGSGIDCRLEPDPAEDEECSELRVAAADADSAAAILFPERRRQLFVASVICPSCGARHNLRQGRVFWFLLAAAVSFLFAVAFFVSHLVLIVLALATAVLLVMVELLLKDWKCARCGHRWRKPPPAQL